MNYKLSKKFISEKCRISEVTINKCSKKIELIPEIIDYYSSNEETIQPHYMNTSNKRDSDSVYYSSLNIDMLIFCLQKFDYPKKQINFLEDNKEKFNHLLYDFGFNYRMNNNKLEITKSGYYCQI